VAVNATACPELEVSLPAAGRPSPRFCFGPIITISCEAIGAAPLRFASPPLCIAALFSAIGHRVGAVVPRTIAYVRSILIQTGKRRRVSGAAKPRSRIRAFSPSITDGAYFYAEADDMMGMVYSAEDSWSSATRREP
jgi:hypothetical protein